jgi:predicted lipoprotein with Yx(FWY)xxD motif
MWDEPREILISPFVLLIRMRPTRRTVLRSVAAGGLTIGLAGCAESGGDPTGTAGGDETPTDTEMATETEMGTETASGTDTGTGTETGTGTGTGTETGTGTDAGSMATVQVRSFEMGDALVGPEGLTLYMFDSDTQGEGASSCSGGCLDNWPPLTVDGEATASADVSAELTTFERDDGSMQVAANGWPLYYFVSDESPGDTNGQAVGDVWWMLTPAGEPIRN